MTQEEAKRILKIYLQAISFQYPGSIAEAIRTLCEPLPLPSDLDEAAEEWCKMNNKGIALSADKKSHYLAEGKDAFKAGAEWQANQGASYETVISADKTIPILPMKDVSEMGFDYGDKVVVQIKKK